MKKTVIVSNNTEKKVYIEMMRIIACSLVIFNHLRGYDLFLISSGIKQFFYMSLAMITRIHVPLFLMISGSLLLKRNEDILVVLKKRVLRIVIVILLFDIVLLTINKVINYRLGNEYELSIERLIYGFFGNKIEGSGAYWYMYSYLGFLFTLPLMQRVAHGINKFEIWILMGLHFFVSTLVPILNLVLLSNELSALTITNDFSVPFAITKPFFYTLIGYYYDRIFDIKIIQKKHIYVFILLVIILISISNACTYVDAKINGQYTQNCVQLFDYILAIVTFLIIKYIFSNNNKLNEGRISAAICFVGSLTLGIYMLDPCIKTIFFGKYNSFMEPILPTLIVSFFWVMISMFCGCVITYILKKIFLLKNIL